MSDANGDSQVPAEKRGIRLGEWLAIATLGITLLGGAVAVARGMFADKAETTTAEIELKTKMDAHVTYQIKNDENVGKAIEKLGDKLDRIETKIDRNSTRREP